MTMRIKNFIALCGNPWSNNIIDVEDGVQVQTFVYKLESISSQTFLNQREIITICKTWSENPWSYPDKKLSHR